MKHRMENKSDSSFPEPTWWNGIDSRYTAKCRVCGEEADETGLCSWCKRDVGDPCEEMEE